MLAPVVIFVYDRLHHLGMTVNALKNNELAQETKLFIYSDKELDEASFVNVGKVREYVDRIDGFKEITVIKRERHFGLADNIIDGVTEVVNKYGKIIVLEDDLVTSECFLRFMNDSLIFYANHKRVMHVSGYVFPINSIGLDDTFFIKPTSCWGWATWDRAWKHFKKDIEYYLKEFDANMIIDFNLNNAYKHFEQIIQNKNGKMNTWAVFWYASVFLNRGLSLHPNISFVQNIGHDGLGGTHSQRTSCYDVDITHHYPIAFTEEILESVEGRKRIEKFHNSLKIPFYQKLINIVRRLLNRAY
jgi:hypothetical protein